MLTFPLDEAGLVGIAGRLIGGGRVDARVALPSADLGRLWAGERMVAALVRLDAAPADCDRPGGP